MTFLSPQQHPAGKKLSPELVSFQKDLGERSAAVSSRLKMVEEIADNLESHISLIESSLAEKHKSVVDDVRKLQAETRNMRLEFDELRGILQRVASRMSAFATKEEIKVLQRYVDLWQPLNYVTRSEIEEIVKEILKEKKKNG